RDEVREHLQEVDRYRHLVRHEVVRKIDRQSKDHRRDDGARRTPTTKNQGGECDVTESRGVANLKLALRGHKGGAANAGDRSTEHDVDVANTNDVDAHGRGRTRMLANGAHVQSITSLKEREAHHGDQ